MQKATFVPRMKNVPCAKPETKYFIGRVTIHPKQLQPQEKKKIPEEY
jgi:hypothetical protein